MIEKGEKLEKEWGERKRGYYHMHEVDSVTAVIMHKQGIELVKRGFTPLVVGIIPS